MPIATGNCATVQCLIRPIPAGAYALRTGLPGTAQATRRTLMTLAFGYLAKKAMLVRMRKRVCTCIALPGEGGVLGEVKKESRGC